MPKTHRLDRRAAALVADEDTGALLNTAALAEWLNVSTQWVEIGRHRGYGPPFVKLAGKVRYRRCDVITWLNDRTHHSTREYQTRGPRQPTRGSTPPAA
jgi:hypothetical protein